MRTYYLVRRGWNAANQSSMGGCRNPKNTFQSNLNSLVGIVEAESESAAIKQFSGSVYNNQSLFAYSNPRQLKGLTAVIREYAAASEFAAFCDRTGV